MSKAPVTVSKVNLTGLAAKARALGIEMVTAKWGVKEVAAYEELINHESHFNPHAGNPTSGACGIYQAYPCAKVLNVCGTLDNIECQHNWGINYISRRYSSPSNALKHWKECKDIMINGKLTNVGCWY